MNKLKHSLSAILVTTLLVFTLYADAARRVVGVHLLDSLNNGVVAVGVIKFKDADPSMAYSAVMSIKENGTLLGSQMITLPAGVDRVKVPTNVDSIIMSRKTTRAGVHVIVARYKFFNVSGLSIDRYEITSQMSEAGVKVAAGTAAIQFEGAELPAFCAIVLEWDNFTPNTADKGRIHIIDSANVGMGSVLVNLAGRMPDNTIHVVTGVVAPEGNNPAGGTRFTVELGPLENPGGANPLVPQWETIDSYRTIDVTVTTAPTDCLTTVLEIPVGL